VRQHGYPEARERQGGPPPALAERFRGPQTTNGLVTVTDAEAEIIHFGANVARVKVLVLDNDAVIRLARVGGSLGSPITIPAGAEWDESAACEALRASNAVAGAVARIQVEGYFL
jgi:hypothetical protein